MLPHGLFSCPYIMSANCVRNSAMTHERLLQPAFQLERALARFPQQVHKGIQDLQDHAIPGCLSYGVVEFRILFDSQLTLVHLFLLATQDIFHIGQFLVRGILGGTPSQSRFDHAPKLEEIADEFALAEQHGSQRIDQGFGRRVTNDSALALARLDKSISSRMRIASRREPRLTCNISASSRSGGN